MLPAYYDGMYLPPGDYLATWQDVIQRFSGNEKRQGFCTRLKAILDQAKICGFVKVYLFGSFISAKDDPGDVDLLWVYAENLDTESLSQGCKDLLDYVKMKEQEEWDMWCCANNDFNINYLMRGWRTDRPPESKPRGVIIIELATL
jgi:hypothetical protein